ncbi:unnamed protein product [Moneuplotes crassus]|uniref:Uncharacterized protein n=1 Tax=Euplotes crassus TaxID=5936 RepID=A0AAD1XT80_EUPCR|nr:unnamed protein product [Moneuplotes crassus]
MNRNIADFSKGFIPEIDLTPKEELQLSSFAEVGIETPNKTFDHKDIDLVASKEDKQAENHEASFTYKDSTLKTNSRDKPFKAQFADRRDVIYKTLIRSVRRFLWDDFSSTLPDVTFSNMTRGCSVFEDFLKRFYQEQFCVGNIHSQKGSNEFAHLQLLSVFMTQYYLIPKRSATSKKIAQALKQIVKKFSPKLYIKFFNLEGVSDFFKLLKSSNYIYKVIDAYPNMKKCEDQYIKAVDSIINFSRDPTLMK